MTATLRQVHDDHAVHLRQYLLSTGCNPQDADEIVQETMLRAWKHLDVISETNPYPWLKTVAKRVMVDVWRKRSCRPREVPDDELEDWVGGHDGGISQVEDRLLVEQLLAEMSPVQRRVMELRYLCDLSVPETAELLGVPDGTVKSRVYYARKTP